MNKLVKRAIEKYIKSIDANRFDDLYDYAYNNLPDDYVKELTDVLSTALSFDAKIVAKENLKKHINDELINFSMKPQKQIMSVSTFLRRHMNHYNGLTFDEVEFLVIDCINKHPNLCIKVHQDSVGETYIEHGEQEFKIEWES